MSTNPKRGIIRRLVRSIFTSVANYAGVPYGSGYNALDPTRKLIERFSSDIIYGRSTANELLNGALGPLRAYCRGLERNNPTARAGIEALVMLVVGTGIRLEPNTENKVFKALWSDFCDNCGTDGSSIYELQRRAFRDIPAAGEALWRFVPTEDEIPLKILPLESEWLIDEVPDGIDGVAFAPGIKLDKYGNPVAYYIQRPDMIGGTAEEVSAESMCHIFEPRRSLQARGEPMFAPLIETLINERQLVDAELYAAKMTAAMAIVIESEADGDPLDTDSTGDPAMGINPGTIARLFPGEKATAFSHTRPSQQIAPFRQMLRGDIAAALRIPVRLLDRDVSRANYSSMRADMLDEMGYIKPMQRWFGEQSIGRVYRHVAPILAAMAGMTEVPDGYRLLPDGIPYVDPLKDAQAAITNIEAGLTTHEMELGIRGHDPEQVMTQRQKEREAAAKADLELAIKMQEEANKANKKVPGLNLNWTQLATLTDANKNPAAYLAAATGSQQATEPQEEPEPEKRQVLSGFKRDEMGRIVGVVYEER